MQSRQQPAQRPRCSSTSQESGSWSVSPCKGGSLLSAVYCCDLFSFLTQARFGSQVCQHVVKSAKIVRLAADFIARRLNGTKYVAVQIRPYPDDCEEGLPDRPRSGVLTVSGCGLRCALGRAACCAHMPQVLPALCTDLPLTTTRSLSFQLAEFEGLWHCLLVTVSVHCSIGAMRVSLEVGQCVHFTSGRVTRAQEQSKHPALAILFWPVLA